MEMIFRGTHFHDGSHRWRRVCVRARSSRSERGHALGYSVSQNELFSQLDVGTALGCSGIRCMQGEEYERIGMGRLIPNKNHSVNR